MLIEQYRHQFGLDCVIIRTGMVYGEGVSKPRFLYNFLRKARLVEDIITHRYKNGLPIVDLIHHEDLARAYEAVIGSSLSEDFNFGSGIGTTTAQIAEILIRVTKSQSIVRQHDIDDFTANIVINPTKAREAFGWSPHVSLETGLLRVAERFP
jgi:nucleoside-diphosphate-sugar epimerase